MADKSQQMELEFREGASGEPQERLDAETLSRAISAAKHAIESGSRMMFTDNIRDMAHYVMNRLKHGSGDDALAKELERLGLSRDDMIGLAKAVNHRDRHIKSGARIAISAILGHIFGQNRDVLDSVRNDGRMVSFSNIKDAGELVESFRNIPKELLLSGLWYLENTLPSGQEAKRRALARVLKEKFGLDADHADNLSKRAFLDREEAAIFNRLRRHSGSSEDEVNQRAHAAALYIAGKKPLFALGLGHLGATSINASVYDNIASTLSSLAHGMAHGKDDFSLSRGHYGSHAGDVRGLAASKLKALIALSDIALSGHRVDETSPIGSAISKLRDVAKRMKHGIKHGDINIDGIESPTPEQLAAYFLMSNHDKDTINSISKGINITGRMIHDIHSIESSLLDFVPRLIRKARGDDVDESELRRAFYKRLSGALKRGVESFVEEAENILVDSGLAEKTISDDGRALLDIASEHRHDSDMANTLRRALKSLNRLSGGLGEYTKAEKGKRDYVSDMHFEHLGKSIPGYAFLGPKIGAYAANLAGDDRIVTYDTWMRFFNPLRWRVDAGSFSWYDTEKHIRSTKKQYKDIIDEINRNDRLKHQLIEHASHALADAAHLIKSELGVSDREALDMTHKAMTSAPSIQAIQWFMARSAHGKLGESESQRNLWQSADYISKAKALNQGVFKITGKYDYEPLDAGDALRGAVIRYRPDTEPKQRQRNKSQGALGTSQRTQSMSIEKAPAPVADEPRQHNRIEGA